MRWGSHWHNYTPSVSLINIIRVNGSEAIREWGSEGVREWCFTDTISDCVCLIDSDSDCDWRHWAQLSVLNSFWISVVGRDYKEEGETFPPQSFSGRNIGRSNWMEYLRTDNNIFQKDKFVLNNKVLFFFLIEIFSVRRAERDKCGVSQIWAGKNIFLQM